MFLHFFSRFRRGSPQWRKEREVWGGESGAMLKVVCGRGWRGGRFMCGDGGVGLFSVAGGCGWLCYMQWEGNGQETDEIT